LASVFVKIFLPDSKFFSKTPAAREFVPTGRVQATFRPFFRFSLGRKGTKKAREGAKNFYRAARGSFDTANRNIAGNAGRRQGFIKSSRGIHVVIYAERVKRGSAAVNARDTRKQIQPACLSEKKKNQRICIVYAPAFTQFPNNKQRTN
jgi:hypothetical protein